MYVRNSSKKRKYLIVKLFGTRSCDGSLYVCCCRYNGCINSRDVHITGFAKLFVLAPLEGFTAVVEFSSDLPMIPCCHVLCVVLWRWWWLGRLAIPVHDAKPTRVVYGGETWRVSLLPHLGDCIKPISTQES